MLLKVKEIAMKDNNVEGMKLVAEVEDDIQKYKRATKKQVIMELTLAVKEEQKALDSLRDSLIEAIVRPIESYKSSCIPDFAEELRYTRSANSL